MRWPAGFGVRSALAIVLLLRILPGPYRSLAGQPAELFVPVWFLQPLPSMPPVIVFVGLQVVGAIAAIAAIARAWGKARWTFAIAWFSLLVLAGLRGSLGKVLHNDVLLLLACVPVLFATADDEKTAAAAARAVVAAVYFAAGVQKLRHSGWDWIASDNFRWVLYHGARSGLAPTRAIALFMADRPWLATTAAAGLLGLELAAPVLLWVRITRLVFLAAAAVLHLGTWLTLGLDYWGWILTVAAVTIPWSRVSGAAK